MIIKTEFLDSPQPYREMWQRQRTLFDTMVGIKRKGGIPTEGHILLLEHQPVITLGRHGDEANIIMASELERRGIECIRIERGGDITYHGPGQLVVYPVIDRRSRDSHYSRIRHHGGTCGGCNGRMDWRRHSGRAQDMRHRSEVQPICDYARSGAKREHRPRCVPPYQSLWVYRQGSDLDRP